MARLLCFNSRQLNDKSPTSCQVPQVNDVLVRTGLQSGEYDDVNALLISQPIHVTIKQFPGSAHSHGNIACNVSQGLRFGRVGWFEFRASGESNGKLPSDCFGKTDGYCYDSGSSRVAASRSTLSFKKRT